MSKNILPNTKSHLVSTLDIHDQAQTNLRFNETLSSGQSDIHKTLNEKQYSIPNALETLIIQAVHLIKSKKPLLKGNLEEMHS